MRIQHRGREFDVDEIRDELDRWRDDGYARGIKHKGAIATAVFFIIVIFITGFLRGLA